MNHSAERLEHRGPKAKAVRHRRPMRVLRVLVLALAVCQPVSADPSFDARAFIDAEIAAHAGLTGAYVLEKGEESLRARAWLADHARISVQRISKAARTTARAGHGDL